MHAMMIRRLPVLALGVMLGAPLAAQQGPRPLPAAEATFDEPFSSLQVGGLRELGDGRVIVADPRDKIVQRLDFRSQQSVTIGGEGSGPGEFGLPLRLYQASADTTFLFDPLNQRYLIIGPDGKPAGTFRMETSAPGAGGGGMLALGAIGRGSDAQGRLYAEGSPVAQGPDGRPMVADSVPLLRFDRRANRIDTLAFIKLPPSNSQVSGGQGNMRVMIGGANPLAPRDEWAVFPDGRVAIARASSYHVDFILSDGTRRSGSSIRFAPIRMTSDEIRYEESLRNQARSQQMSISVSSGSGGTQRTATMGPPPGAPPLEPLTNWPEVKPPFRSGQGSVLARANGELWIRRTEDRRASGTLYDVINPQGQVAYQVRVPEGVNVVGFGNGTVYTTVRDADDLLFLRRHRF